MKLLLENWRQYNSNPLQEAMPEERAHIKAALELEPEQLAFNDLFDGKKRLVYELPAADKETEAGRFVSLWAEMGYKVDWNKGIVTGEKADPRTFSVDYLADEILADAGLIAQSAIPKTRTIKMKIGKWFSKVQGYVDKILKMNAEVEEKTGKSMLRSISMQEIEKALGKEGAKEFNRNVDMLNMLATEEVGIRFLKSREYTNSRKARDLKPLPDRIKELAKFWQNNADYLKKNIDDLLSGLKGYAVVITRHPMDVFRMGDFMEIYDSCHRPPSKRSLSGTRTNEYYQCAIAEAHGHGAIAYVVDREALLDATDASTLEEVEDTIQEGELFKDEDMPYFETGELLPIQRIRLRQVRYYTDDLSSKHAGKITLDDLDDASDEEIRAIYLHAKAGKEAGPGVELAVPEMDTGHLYGTRIPEFGPWLLNWAQQNQTEELRRAPRTDSHPFTQHGDEPWQWGTLDLSKFVKFGGSYEDTPIKKLITHLYGPKMPAIGYPVQDRTTQDNLDVEIVDTTVEEYQVECNIIAEKWNNDYADCVVEADVYDDGGGDAAIGIKAEMWVYWSLDEWKRLPNPVEGQHAADELSDAGLTWINDSGGGIWRRDKQVVMKIQINPEGVLGFDKAYAFDPEDFTNFCVELNKIDDQRDMVKAELERYFLREGDLKGSELQQWGANILNDWHDIIRWDLEVEEGYDREIESVTATIHPVVKLGDVPREVADNILGSWNFWTKIRSIMADAAQQEVGSQYFPDSEHDVLDSNDDEIETELKFIAEADDPDEQVEVMKVMVDKWDDLDEVNELVNNIFRHFVDLASQGYEITEEQRLLRVEKLLRMV